MNAQDVVNNARRLLRDADPDQPQYDDPTLMAWLNEGYIALVTLKPSANTVERIIGLQPGMDQQLPADAIALVRPMFNLGLDGYTRGPTITAADRDTLLNFVTSVGSVEPDAIVQHILYDDQQPLTFQVYPPQPIPPTSISVAMSAIPKQHTSLNEVLSLPSLYSPVLTDYICYRALAEDSGNQNNREKSDRFQATFFQALGARLQSQIKYAPVRESRP